MGRARVPRQQQEGVDSETDAQGVPSRTTLGLTLMPNLSLSLSFHPPQFGSFPFGSTRVSYVASDASGNEATCDIDIVIQGRLGEARVLSRRVPSLATLYLRLPLLSALPRVCLEWRPPTAKPFLPKNQVSVIADFFLQEAPAVSGAIRAQSAYKMGAYFCCLHGFCPTFPCLSWVSNQFAVVTKRKRDERGNL